MSDSVFFISELSGALEKLQLQTEGDTTIAIETLIKTLDKEGKKPFTNYNKGAQLEQSHILAKCKTYL